MAEAKVPLSKAPSGGGKAKPTGRKGGTIFPRLPLDKSLSYAKKLVSRTAIGPQPESTILAGVFNNSGGKGKIRLSALKQFGLLEGTVAAYKATQLAKDIDAAPDETTRMSLLRRAILSPRLYREIYNTFHGDSATRAQIRSRALGLDVHPDAGDTCTDLFIASAITAGIGTAEGDGLRLASATDSVQTTSDKVETDEDETSLLDADGPEAAASPKIQQDLAQNDSQAADSQDVTKPELPRRRGADITLNLTVDSSLDGEKLEKQLALLRKFGLI